MVARVTVHGRQLLAALRTVTIGAEHADRVTLTLSAATRARLGSGRHALTVTAAALSGSVSARKAAVLKGSIAAARVPRAHKQAVGSREA